MAFLSSAHLTIAPVALPLLSAILTLALPRFGRTLSVLGALATLAAAMALVTQAASGNDAVYLLGNWQAPFGIALLADRLSAWAVLATAWVLFGVLVFIVGGDQDRAAFTHPLFHVLWMGVNGAFLTADVFNLFVFFEVMLVGSYGLALLGAGPREAGATLRYVAINLAGSALFLIAAGLLYGVAGSLSFADLAQRLPALAPADQPLARAGAGLLAVVFLLKAAALPLSAWLPQTYGRISPVSAAAFTLLTKLGAYSLLRITSLWGPALDDGSFSNCVLLAGVGTMLLAGFGALASLSLTQVATWGVLGSSGFLLIVFNVGSLQTLAAGLMYLPASAASASALYLVADLHARGRLGNAKLWLLAAAVCAGGLPPAASFLAKIQALHGLLASSAFAWVAVALLLASLMLVIGFARAGLRAAGAVGGPAHCVERLALLWLCGGVVALTVFAAPVQRYALAAAAGLASPNAYVRAVLGARPVGVMP